MTREAGSTVEEQPPYLYILDEDGVTPVPCHDAVAWGNWFSTVENRCLCRTNLGELGEVSTVFLGSSFSSSPDVGRSLMWETMVFGGPLNPDEGGGAEYRDATWCRAAARHRMVVRQLKKIGRLLVPGAPPELADAAVGTVIRLSRGRREWV